jgi:hypothetical protein
VYRSVILLLSWVGDTVPHTTAHRYKSMEIVKMNILQRLSIIVTMVTAVGVLTSNEAQAAGGLLRFLALFSADPVPLLDGNGKPIFDEEVAHDKNGNVIRDAKGNPVKNKIAKYAYRWDPVGEEILKLGLDITYDPSKVKVVTDVSGASSPLESAFGFYCGFSTNGSCPKTGDPFMPDEFGDPLIGSTVDLDIDNVLGKLTLSYDFSSTPVTITEETNFFGFIWEPVVIGVVDGIFTLPSNELDVFVQHPESSKQFCITKRTEETGLQCSIPVPEPSSTLSFLALGTLGAASTLKHKLKPSKSTEKETRKVG